MPDDETSESNEVSDEIIAELKTKYGEIHSLEAADEIVIVRSPPFVEWQRFRSMMADEAQKSTALDTLTRACVVYPDKAVFSKLLDRKPGLAETFGNELMELAGLAKKAKRKKY